MWCYRPFTWAVTICIHPWDLPREVKFLTVFMITVMGLMSLMSLMSMYR
jgi:hypothetical protein